MRSLLTRDNDELYYRWLAANHRWQWLIAVPSGWRSMAVPTEQLLVISSITGSLGGSTPAHLPILCSGWHRSVAGVATIKRTNTDQQPLIIIMVVISCTNNYVLASDHDDFGAVKYIRILPDKGKSIVACMDAYMSLHVITCPKQIFAEFHRLLRVLWRFLLDHTSRTLAMPWWNWE